MRKELEQLTGKIFHKYFFLLLFIFSCFIFNNKASAQDTSASTKLRISILTCDAGSDLYTIWGHTAVRVVDSINNTDYVFNFGTFDFETPNFIAKFMRGDLNYFIAANDFSSFYKEYKDNGRAVHEQVLKLSATEKEKWYQALIINMREENKFYLYNFISDNCTTRIKDGLFKHAPWSSIPPGVELTVCKWSGVHRHIPVFWQVINGVVEQLSCNPLALMLLLDYKADDRCHVFGHGWKSDKVFEIVGGHPANHLFTLVGKVSLHGAIVSPIAGTLPV